MKKRLYAIWSVLLVLVVSVAVLVPGCGGGAGQCTIEVRATVCGVPYQGALEYTLTLGAGAPITGHDVPAPFDDVDCGTWTCACVTGPPGTYFVDITPNTTQTVSDGGKIIFTLNFEENQDAGIVFVSWTINGQYVEPNTEETAYNVTYHDIIGVVYEQHVAGCEGYNVTINEMSELQIHCLKEEGEPLLLYVFNDPCAVAKTPPPLEKVSQVPSFNGTPVEQGMTFELWPCEPALLDVETVWQLEKCTSYNKTIDWLHIGECEEPPCCVLFDLWFEDLRPLLIPEPLVFQLETCASVELVDDVDVNPENNSTGWSNPILYISAIPQPIP
jgi:hypothetical protein